MTSPTRTQDETARDAVERYDPAEIEPRWQARWDELGLHDTDLEDTSRPSYYLLTMYPYPSGDLHIGHWYIKTPSDARARFLRMNGNNVFFPIGFDAFGLPAEERRHQAAASTPPSGRCGTSRTDAAPAAKHGRDLRLGQRSRHLSAGVLPLEPVDLPAASSRPAWPIGRWRRSTGARTTRSCSRASRSRASSKRLLALWHARSSKRDLEQWFFRITKYADELLELLRGPRVARAHPV